MKTVTVLPGNTIFSRLKSLLSNSDGVLSSLVTRTLNLVWARTFSVDGMNWWLRITSLYSAMAGVGLAPKVSRCAPIALANPSSAALRRKYLRVIFLHHQAVGRTGIVGFAMQMLIVLICTRKILLADPAVLGRI